MDTLQSFIMELIDQDALVREALERGIANKSATARWLTNRYDIEATHDRVVEALGEHMAEPRSSPRMSAIKMLRGAAIHRRGPVWLRSCESGEGSMSVGKVCSRRTWGHLLEGGFHLASSHPRAISAGEPSWEIAPLPPASDVIDGTEGDLVEFVVQYREPEGGGASPLGFILSNLKSCGIRPVFAESTPDGLSVIVPGDRHRLTYELLITITRQGYPPPMED